MTTSQSRLSISSNVSATSCLKRKIETALYIPDAAPDVLAVELDKQQYTNLDLVRGSVKYNQLNVHDRLLTVSLVGVTHHVGQHWNIETSQYETRRTEWVFLKQPMHVDLDVSGVSPFSIQIPDTLQPSQCPVCDLEHLRLPPSLGKGRPDTLFDMTDCDMNVRIVYQIKAELRHLETDEVESIARQQFLFVPRAPEPEVSELQAYCKPLSSTFGRRWGMLVMTFDKHATIQTSGRAEQVTSSISAQFTYKGPQPPQLSKVEVVLQARTARRVTHQHGKDQSNDFPGFYKRKLQSIKLDEDAIDWRHSTKEDSTWHAELSLPVTLSDDKQLAVLPSFETCLVSRSYMLNLKLHMTKGSSRAQSIDICLPITIRSTSVATAVKCDTLMPSYDEAMMTTPSVAPISAVPPYTDPMPDFERLRRPEWFEKAQADSLSSQSSCRGYRIAAAC